MPADSTVEMELKRIMGSSDFIVVGGGIYGAAITYELTKAGASVTLLESGYFAERASGGPGKRGVRTGGRTAHDLTLMREALELWPTLHDELSGETGFEPLGGLFLVTGQPSFGEIGLHRAKAMLKLQRDFGIEAELLDRGELDRLEPGIGPEEIAAIYCPNDGIVDQRSTTQSYISAAARLGAIIREQTAVAHISAENPRLVHLKDGSQERANRAVVVAANYGTNEVLQSSGRQVLPMWTMVPQVLMFEASDGFLPRHLVNHSQKTVSIKPLANNVTMITGGLRGSWDPISSRGEVVEEMIGASLEIASSVFPALSDGKVTSATASLPETYTPDGLPYVDFLDSDEQLFVASGWSGHGFAIAPSLAKHIATWLHGGNKSKLLSPFGIRNDRGTK